MRTRRSKRAIRKTRHPLPTKFDLDSVRDLGNIFEDRHYVYNGITVPRVTKILSSCIHSDSLMYWANYLGFKHKGYKDTLMEAADYGTKVHEALEHYIKGDPFDPSTPLNPIQAFENWWAQVTRTNKVKVLGQEFSLTCPWYGGTYDMLLEINGHPWLVDFKTSNHIRVNYCLQLAAYRNMLKYNGIVGELAGFIVLRLFKDKPAFEEFVIDMARPDQKAFMDQCSSVFNAMAYQYWNMMDIEKKFNQIHKEELNR